MSVFDFGKSCYPWPMSYDENWKLNQEWWALFWWGKISLKTLPLQSLFLSLLPWSWIIRLPAPPWLLQHYWKLPKRPKSHQKQVYNFVPNLVGLLVNLIVSQWECSSVSLVVLVMHTGELSEYPLDLSKKVCMQSLPNPLCLQQQFALHTTITSSFGGLSPRGKFQQFIFRPINLIGTSNQISTDWFREGDPLFKVRTILNWKYIWNLRFMPEETLI